MMFKSLTHSTTTIRCDLVASNKQASRLIQHHILEKKNSLCKDSLSKDRVTSTNQNIFSISEAPNNSTTEGQFSFKMFTNIL